MVSSLLIVVGAVLMLWCLWTIGPAAFGAGVGLLLVLAGGDLA